MQNVSLLNVYEKPDSYIYILYYQTDMRYYLVPN